mmetsp:Transcript_35828/g.112555  ORF Transcript_35828/g.112555 Transcript_35828/m.112555 type:complete len:471 (-) Transcript_35828:1315-2727(-)
MSSPHAPTGDDIPVEVDAVVVDDAADNTGKPEGPPANPPTEPTQTAVERVEAVAPQAVNVRQMFIAGPEFEAMRRGAATGGSTLYSAILQQAATGQPIQAPEGGAPTHPVGLPDGWVPAMGHLSAGAVAGAAGLLSLGPAGFQSFQNAFGMSVAAARGAFGLEAGEHSPSMTAQTPRLEWRQEEDETIRQGVALHGAKWRFIASQLPHRSDDAVRNRWSRLKAAGGAAANVPGKRGGGAAGSPPPDCPPPCGANSVGSQPEVAARPPKRAKGADEKRISWTKSEDAVITSCVREFGHRWAKIKERLPSRTEHAIRNRWHRLLKLAEDKAQALGSISAHTSAQRRTERERDSQALVPPDGAYPLSVACPPPGDVAGFRGAHAGSEAAMVEAAMAAAAAAAGQNPAAAAACLAASGQSTHSMAAASAPSMTAQQPPPPPPAASWPPPPSSGAVLGRSTRKRWVCCGVVTSKW